MSTKPVNNDMDMLSVSRIRNLPAATEDHEPVTRAQMEAGRSYLHIQATPSDQWVIVHGLNRYPAVTVIDSAGSVVYGDIKYDSKNQCTLSFVGGFSGKASLS